MILPRYILHIRLLALFLLFSSCVNLCCQTTENRTGILTGRKIFYGDEFIYQTRPACIDCHRFNTNDTMLYWYPSAYDIAKKFKEAPPKVFQEAINNASSKKKQQVHQYSAISLAEAKRIMAYLSYKLDNRPAEKWQFNTNWIYFTLALLLILLIIVDTCCFKFIGSKPLILILFLGAVIVLIFSLKNIVHSFYHQVGYAPEQPIKFSHKIHTDNSIECVYCHTISQHGAQAGMPAAQVCLHCHNLIMEGEKSGRFEIEKIHHAFNNKKQIEWVKVSSLPAHVQFKHAVHLKNKKLNCTTCHGNIEWAHTTRQHTKFTMQWCIGCHKEMNISPVYHANTFVIQKQMVDTINVFDFTNGECNKCHY